MRQYCEKQEKEIVEEEVEESISKLTTFNLNTRKESEQEAKSALVRTLFVSCYWWSRSRVTFFSSFVIACSLFSTTVPGVAVLH